MTSYGFKLFKMSVRLRGGSTPKLFGSDGKGQGRAKSDVAPWHYGLHAQTLITAHLHEKRRGLPPLPGADESTLRPIERSTPVFRATKVDLVGNNLFLTVEEGQNRGFEHAMATDEADPTEAFLGDKAPHRPYRAALIMPEQGTTAILAVECIDGRCPAQAIKSWLRQWSIEASIGTQEDNRWWNLVGRQLTDSQQLRRIAQEGNLEEIVLMRTRSNRGGTGRTNDMTLRAPLRGKAARDRVGLLVEEWITREESKTGSTPPPSPGTDDSDVRLSDRTAARAMSVLLGENLDKVDFDDGYVRASGGETGSTQISPSRLHEVFIYSISSGEEPPTASGFYTAVRSRVRTFGDGPAQGLDLEQWFEEE